MFWAKRSILDPIRTIFDDLGANRHRGPDLDLQDQAGDDPLEWVGPGLSSVETRQMYQQQSYVLSQQQTSVRACSETDFECVDESATRLQLDTFATARRMRRH